MQLVLGFEVAELLNLVRQKSLNAFLGRHFKDPG